MTARTFLVPSCDVRRYAAGCHERYEVLVKHAGSAEALPANPAVWRR